MVEVSLVKGDNGCLSLLLHGWAIGALSCCSPFLLGGKKDIMRITNRSMILIVKDGQIFRANTISKRLEKPIAGVEMLLKGKQLPKIFLEQVLADLEYLKYMADAIKKQGTGNAGNR